MVGGLCRADNVMDGAPRDFFRFSGMANRRCLARQTAVDRSYLVVVVHLCAGRSRIANHGLEKASMNGWVGAVGVVLTAFLANYSVIVLSKSQRKKVDADAADTLTETAISLVAPLKERLMELETKTTEQAQRIEELETRVTEQKELILELQEGAERLAHQVRSLGGSPVFAPKPKEKKKGLPPTGYSTR